MAASAGHRRRREQRLTRMQRHDDDFAGFNETKASFDEVYNEPDPRRYYRALGALDYRIPTEAKPVLEKVIAALDRRPVSIADIGCSYGVNAALLRYDLEFSDLVARYRARRLREESVAEAIFDDAAFFSDAPKSVDAQFTGVDIAKEAVGYAKAVGLVEEAVAENLEERLLSQEGASALASTDLIISTGAVGYVTEKTFARVIDAVDGPPPWVAAFCLRQFPFDAIAAELEGFGLRTEKLEGRYFQQRRFKDAEERAAAIAAVAALGLDPDGLEADGAYYAEFYLAKPVGAPPIAEVVRL